MASMSNYNLPTKTSQSHKDFEEDEDDQDGFQTPTMNSLRRYQVKKSRKITLESLEEKDRDVSLLKVGLEETKSCIGYDQSDHTKNMRYSKEKLRYLGGF